MLRSVGTGTSGTGTSATVPVPASAAVDDIAVICLYTENATDTSSTGITASGFTLRFDSGTSNGATRGRLVVFYKRLTAADTGNYTVSWTTSSPYEAVCTLHSGRIKTGDPFSVQAGGGGATSGATTIALSTGVVTQYTQDDQLACASNHATNAGAWTPPSGSTEAYDNSGSGTAHLSVAYQDVPEISSQSGSFTLTGTTGNSFPRYWVGMLMADPDLTRVQTVGSVSGAPAGTSSFTVSSMPTHDVGYRLRLVVGGKYDGTTIPAAPSGWSLVGSATGGVGGSGADTGNVFLAIYEMDATSSSETAPTVSAGGTAPNSWNYVVTSYKPPTGYRWADVAGTSAQFQAGADSTTGTVSTASISAFSSQPTSRDAIQMAHATPTDSMAGTWNCTSSVTGLTGGNLVNGSAASSTRTNSLGDDSGMTWYSWDGFFGTASAGMTLSWSHASSGTNAGTGVLAAATLRITLDNAASGSGSLSLSASGGAAGAADGSGSLSLSGSGAWTAVGTGALSLSGSADTTSAIDGTGSLSLSGSGAGSGAVDGAASLSLSGSGSAESAVTGSGSLTLSGTGDLSGSRAVDGTASLSLSGSGAASVVADGSGSLSLSGSGAGVVALVASASLSLSGSGSVAQGAIGTGSLSLAGSGAARGSPGGSGTLVLTAASVTITPQNVTVQGVGRINLTDEALTFAGEMRVTILDPEVVRAPTSITVVLLGAVAQTDVTFDIDGTDIYTVSTDSEGALGPTSLNVSAALGTLGTHTLTVTQGSVYDSEDFVVLRAPSPYPLVVGVDAPPVWVAEALVMEGSLLVRHWVFQDLLAEVEGGIGSYVFPHNPEKMTSPHYEHALSSRHSTASDGKDHVFQAGMMPKEWQLTGYSPTQAHQEAILEYRHLNRRFWIIDHHNRAWKAIITNAEFVARLRQNYNGEVTDWGADFTITATVLDQEFATPEEP